MNKIIEQSLAKEVLALSNKRAKDDYILYSKNDVDNTVQTSKISNKEAISKILNFGISLSMPVEIEHRGDIKIKPLITLVMDNILDGEIIDLFLSKIDSKTVREMSVGEINDLYQAVEDEHKESLLDRLFNNGFDFKQGSFDETDKAINLDFVFFEYCLKYKKDFDFSYKYEEELTLDEIVEEEKEYFKEKKIAKYSSNRADSFVEFLKKVKESQNLKRDLKQHLIENQQNSKANFKI